MTSTASRWYFIEFFKLGRIKRSQTKIKDKETLIKGVFRSPRSLSGVWGGVP